jgi:23S rRNA (cytidine1920-2'-O)/16S rRNA (cytidine1409-2'-O)-methyltransferase
MKIKKRLDARLVELYPAYSKTQLQSWIMQGKVSVNEKIISKAGTQVSDDDQIVLTIEEPKYVCRAGWKLEKALDEFKIDVTNKVILDAGLSTGGFTDCLLQRGTQKVYGVDVGYGQVHEKIRQDPRVVVLEKTNLRYLTDVGEKVDLITLDLSFISLLKVMGAVKDLLKPTGELITLIKPQFEAERHEIGKGCIIKDAAVHKRVVEQVIAGIEAQGFIGKGIIESPILGSSGNKEFLAYFVRK